MASSHTRCQRIYDHHRLCDLVRTVGNPEIVAEFGVPRSTALGWLRGKYGPVVTTDILDKDATQLQAEILKLRRRIRMLAAIVRLLIAPQFVKPYVKSNKNDAVHAEAIAEAAQRPNMRFVAVKEVGQQDIPSIHRMRSLVVAQRTAQGNQIRGVLLEYGIVHRRLRRCKWDGPF